MSGFLDSKTRIFDTIITEEGRSQISVGKLKAAYYSFTDAGAFYSGDTTPSGAISPFTSFNGIIPPASAASEATSRLYFEASSLPQDMISIQADDAGKLFKFPGSTTAVLNGQILLPITSVFVNSNGLVTTGTVYDTAVGNDFASAVTGVLESTINNFNKLYIIGSPDIFDESLINFRTNIRSASFDVNDNNPPPAFPSTPGTAQAAKNGNLETANTLFNDNRLSHLPNFLFLPPINKPQPGITSGSSLGNFDNLNAAPIESMDTVESQLGPFMDSGYGIDIEFINTSKPNNLVCQLFEASNGQVIKLDVIDFGLFDIRGQDVTQDEKKRAEKDPRARPNPTKHVFFCGKVFTDSTNTHKFFNIFTLIFE